MVTEQDIVFMRRAMELAERGHGFVHPNPYVGAVVVKNGRVIGEGWHEYCGGPHAERNAFASLSESAEGATLYVTLEPCCHYGKTPPCTEAVIENGIKRVVAGLADPNPKVAGKGLAILREAGIETECGVLEDELRDQNRIFLKYITTGMPWVAFKTAMTLDGKIATSTGDSRWVSCEESRMFSQRMRGEFAAIAVGSGTVRADDPMLTCRLDGEVHQPLRIVVDSRACVPEDSAIVRSAGEYAVLVAHTGTAPEERLRLLRDAGVETLCCDAECGRVSVGDMLKKLGAKGVDSLILEGGSTLAESFVRGGYVDEVYAFIAPKIAGGECAKTPVGGRGFEKMSEAAELESVSVCRIGSDILVRGRIIKND